MNQEEYQKLNNYLNDIFCYLEENDHFLLQNMEEIAILNDRVNDIVSSYEYVEAEKNHLTFYDVYNLARDIIETIDQKYLPFYDSMIDNGTIDFDYEDKYFCSFYRGIDTSNGKINLININREFSYDDVVSLVHEFMHYTNGKNDKLSINRYLLTEFISIYYEMYAEDYLREHKLLLDDNKYSFRLQILKEDTDSLYKYEIPFIAFKCFGNLKDETLNDLKQYIIGITKEQYENELKNLLQTYEAIDENTDDKDKFISHLTLAAKDNYRYILGTLFAIYARKNISIEKIKKLNDNINDYTISIVDLLKTIGIEIDSDNIVSDLMDSLLEYIEEKKLVKKK